jgi:ketosteroid isomerase-like protein
MKAAVCAVFLAAGLGLAAAQAARAEEPAVSRTQIEGVIESFRSAIVRKDKDAFLKLFLKPDITWTGVLPDKSVEMLYASRPKPEMKPPSKGFNSSPADFIDFIVKNPAPLEETFSNLRIDTDGDVAQVWFDYSFKAGDYRQNWGKESWQMVRVESGWKIAAVVWSQELNPTPPPKR